MTWVDAIVLAVLVGSALFAFMRGFVREALGIGAWVGALYAAIALAASVRPEARHLIANSDIADPVAFGAVFLAALVVLSVVASLLARVVRFSGLGGLDRMIGLLFGLLRGGVLVSAAYIGGGLLFAAAQWPDAVLGARSLPYAYEGARWIVHQVPDRYAPRLEAPPSAARLPAGTVPQPVSGHGDSP